MEEKLKDDENQEIVAGEDNVTGEEIEAPINSNPPPDKERPVKP
jgi:hypothetical protein